MLTLVARKVDLYPRTGQPFGAEDAIAVAEHQAGEHRQRTRVVGEVTRTKLGDVDRGQRRRAGDAVRVQHAGC